MKLQTEIQFNPEKDQIDYSSKVLLLGSCFSENMGAKFEYFKFENIQNPFGIIFNPISLGNLVGRALQNKAFNRQDIFRYNDTWKSFEVSSKLTAVDEDEFLKQLNLALEALREAIFSSSHIILTLGSSWVYRHVKKDVIVSNCHKVPQKEFTKELLKVDEIYNSLYKATDEILKVNPKASVIFTVSPVRHIKDGFAENTRSKAHLITAVHSVIENFEKLFYFPSYELMMDELRDYRFYSQDMLHPNHTAIEIIWEKFSEVWISSKTKEMQKKINSIQKDLKHLTFNPAGREFDAFSKRLADKIAFIKQEMPDVDF